MRKAKAVKPKRAESIYKSKVEEAWAENGGRAISTEFGQEVEPEVFYEPFVMRVAERLRYIPDFLHILEDGSIVLVEVKGSEFQRGFRSSLNKVKMVAKLYPMFYYIIAISTPKGWQIRRIHE